MACLYNIWANVRTLNFLVQWENMWIFFIHLLLSRDSYIKTSYKWGNNMKVLGFFTRCLRLLVKVSRDKCSVYSDLLSYTSVCPNNCTGKGNKSISYKKWTFMNTLARYSLHNKRTRFFPFIRHNKYLVVSCHSLLSAFNIKYNPFPEKNYGTFSVRTLLKFLFPTEDTHKLKFHEVPLPSFTVTVSFFELGAHRKL
jgi:hypothetical protein